MHSTDKDLLSLLVDDETSTELQTIAGHVETCARCQARLHELSGAGRWTQEVVTQLRASGYANGVDQLDLTEEMPRTIVEPQASDSGESEIEVDPVRLDFLGSPAHPELLGRLGRYDIERVVGAGGMGIVLKGYDSELHRAVAIKVLAPHLAHSAAARRRFAREAQATAAVIHPNVIPIHNVECEGKTPYLVMRYINGQSLQARVDQEGPLAVIDALRIAQQTAAGLAAAHAQGLIHRDVKPANILLDEGIERVVLSDFGLARTVDDASLTHTGIVTGTPHYMSPEQAGGDSIDCRSDLFSLGCVLWFMLAGRPPFRAATAMGVLNRICHDTHHDIRQINNSVPVPLARIIDRLLAKRPDERTPSAEVLEQELLDVTRAIQSGQLSLEPAGSNSRHAYTRTRWKRLSLTAAGIACVATIVLIGVGNRLDWLSVEMPNAQLRSEQTTLPLGGNNRSSVAKIKGDRTPNTHEDSISSTEPYTLSRIGTGDRWHTQAESLQRELHTITQQDRQAVQWVEILQHIQPTQIEQLANRLDALEQENAGLHQLMPQLDTAPRATHD